MAVVMFRQLLQNGRRLFVRCNKMATELPLCVTRWLQYLCQEKQNGRRALVRCNKMVVVPSSGVTKWSPYLRQGLQNDRRTFVRRNKMVSVLSFENTFGAMLLKLLMQTK